MSGSSLPSDLEYVSVGKTTSGHIDRIPMTAIVPAIYQDKALRIPINDIAAGMEGEIAIVPDIDVRETERERLKISAVTVWDKNEDRSSDNCLLRGGFRVGGVLGIPRTHKAIVSARVRMLWRGVENRRYSTTNLSRTGVADERTLSGPITEAWLRYLVENRIGLPEGFLWGIDLDYQREHITRQLWLEQYPASTLYELARNGWHYEHADAEKNLDAVHEWENGKASVRISGAGIHSDILNRILPRIAPNRSFREKYADVCIEPPVPGWRNILSTWYDYLSKPVRWSSFVSFGENMSQRLYADGFLNKMNADRLTGFNDLELDRIESLLANLTHNKVQGRQSNLEPRDLDLLARLIDSAGDLEISRFENVSRLDSFKP